MTSAPFIPVILCGGTGSRLWPLSSAARPKQFVSIDGGATMLEKTARRIARLGKAGAIIAVTHKDHAARVRQDLETAGAGEIHILSEPCRRNTAAAVALAALHAERAFGGDTMLWIAPSDHHIGDETALGAALDIAAGPARDGRLVIFGIKPDRPEIAYGYIRKHGPDAAGVADLAQFIEKPDGATAQTLCDSGEWLWNSGMAMARTDALLAEYRLHAPDLLSRVAQARGPDGIDGEIYAALPALPLDKAILEKSKNVSVVPCDPQWSDIGSWQSLWQSAEKDANGNAVTGQGLCVQSQDCLVMSDKKLIVCAGVRDLLVVERDGMVIVTDRRAAGHLGVLRQVIEEKGLE